MNMLPHAPSALRSRACASLFRTTCSTHPPACFRAFEARTSTLRKRALMLNRSFRRPMLTMAVAGTAAVGVAGLIAVVDAARKTRKPTVMMQPTDFNTSVVDLCAALHEPYKPFPFLTNGHVETIFAAKFRTAPQISYRREIIQGSDGGSIALDWEHFDDHEKGLPDDAPVLLLLPGLTGGSSDTYILHAVDKARSVGIRAVVFNGRGTANSPVTTPQFYSASYTGDMRTVVAHVTHRYPQSQLFAAGWSLGANILVRYLGEEGARTPIRAAVSMCNPFDLTISNANFEKGFNRIYDINLANSLSAIFRKHELLWNGMPPPFNPKVGRNSKTIREFDDAITIHSFGWPSVDEYYAGSSSSLSVPHVRIPLLCVQALDDPIAPKEAIPYEACKENPNVILVTTATGGHLGWVSGEGAPFGHPWTDRLVVEYLSAVRKLGVPQVKPLVMVDSEEVPVLAGGLPRYPEEDLPVPSAMNPVNRDVVFTMTVMEQEDRGEESGERVGLLSRDTKTQGASDDMV